MVWQLIEGADLPSGLASSILGMILIDGCVMLLGPVSDGLGVVNILILNMTCAFVNCVKEYSSIIHKRQQQKTSDQQKASEAVSHTHTVCYLLHILAVTW